MPDDQGRYTSAELDAFRDPICPVCGRRGIQYWADATSDADGDLRYWLPSRAECPNRWDHSDVAGSNDQPIC